MKASGINAATAPAFKGNFAVFSTSGSGGPAATRSTIGEQVVEREPSSASAGKAGEDREIEDESLGIESGRENNRREKHESRHENDEKRVEAREKPEKDPEEGDGEKSYACDRDHTRHGKTALAQLSDEVPVGGIPDMRNGFAEQFDELVVKESRDREETDDEQAEIREARFIRV